MANGCACDIVRAVLRADLHTGADINGWEVPPGMIKIAFCDDELSVLNQLRVLLDQYRVDRNLEIEYTAFQSPLELLAQIERGARFDILFLDVLMPGETGIDAAAEIRQYDSNVKIIFLTSSAEFAVESYTVGAYFYQLKPVWPESFFRLMDSAAAACEKEQGDSLILRCKTGITRIEMRQLEYCEVVHRTLYFHLTDGQVLESVGSLDELSRQLESSGRFLRPHRSYLVNLDHIQNLSSHIITMASGASIPLPRGKYHEVKDAYLEHTFQCGQMLV